MIYFIKQLDFVKIGCTNNIQKRLNQLQVGSINKLQVIGLIEGNYEDEKLHHIKFKHLNSSGEWFNYTEELETYINSLDRELMWKYGFDKQDINILGLVKSCRLQENLSLEELGYRLGVTKQTVNELEIREVYGTASIKTIFKALNAMGYRFECRAVKL
jgi:hypothetical protein